jgi:glycosyl transferase family 1
MRIVQIVLPGAGEFEKKSQRIDFASLSANHEVIVAAVDNVPPADIAHVYGPVPRSIRLAMPYVSSSAPAQSRFAFRKVLQPAVILSVLGPRSSVLGSTPRQPRTEDRGPRTELAPEAVEEVYFAASAKEHAPSNIIGTFARASVANIVDQTLHRIGRFRDDVTWNLFDRPPTPDDLAGVDVWVDPAIDENDLDGFVAEALVSGKIVAATRTEVNAQRLENGRTGLLVPRNDPNELTHAILAALFKPEVARSKIEAARQTAGKFRPRQRSRVLERIYETVIR